MAARERVFISYSHVDEPLKDRLVAHLRVLEFEGELDVWDDRRIAAGDNWQPEIELAIGAATVAILIVSKHFLGSRFIREQELTQILLRRAGDGLRVIPLIAEPSAWQAVSQLRGIQARPKDGHPLSGLSSHQIDVELSALAIELLDASAPSATSSPGIPDTEANSIRSLLKGDTPVHLRALIVMLLFIGASASLVMIVFALNFLLALRGAQGIDPLRYVLILSAHCFAGVAIGFPVTIRMASLSEADRLERVFLDAKQRRDISS